MRTGVRPLGQEEDAAREMHKIDSRGVRRQRVATDGSAKGASMGHKWRRAGYGLAWGDKHPQNFGGPLLGAWQSSQRAELTAALKVARKEAQR